MIEHFKQGGDSEDSKSCQQNSQWSSFQGCLWLGSEDVNFYSYSRPAELNQYQEAASAFEVGVLQGQQCSYPTWGSGTSQEILITDTNGWEK